MKYMERSLILSLLLCSGCTALETRESRAWLALHAVDTVQTLRIAGEPNCYKESDKTTRAIIGDHPSTAEVLAWSAASAGIHLGVTELLLRNNHPRLAKVWQYVRIGVTASAVAQNYSIGVRIGSPNEHKPGDCLAESPPLSQPSRPIG